MKFRRWTVGMALAAGLLAGAAQASMVTVGNPGNAGELSGVGAGGSGLDAIVGGVGYEYQIGKYEVTAGEWRNFLNAVDPTGENARGLYNPSMNTNGYGCQITWNEVLSTYDFSGRPSGAESDWVNRPVNYVTWYAAARYTNWLTTGNTESGVYNTSTWEALAHDTAATTLGVRVAYFIPTEDEWYKAAYYNPAGVLYYDYPTSSNTPPTSEAPPGGDNSANYNWAVAAPYVRNIVGAYTSSDSPYGTFDQGGNVWEWNETSVSVSTHGIRGGWSGSPLNLLHADNRSYHFVPTHESYGIGLRVASITIPEPASALLLGFAGLLAVRRRRRA